MSLVDGVVGIEAAQCWRRLKEPFDDLRSDLGLSLASRWDECPGVLVGLLQNRVACEMRWDFFLRRAVTLERGRRKKVPPRRLWPHR